MSVSNKIFIIKDKNNGIIAFYSHLEKAKDELKKFLEKAKDELKKNYNKTIDFKYYYYEINVYILVENEYIITNESYTYNFDNFSTKNKV